MDDTSAVVDLLEDLSSNIDALEDASKPLLAGGLHKMAGDLPAIEKAKLYTLSAYAIESVLFSYLRLNSTNSDGDARSHPVFTELKRVQQYMEKIKNAEHPEAQQKSMSLDKNAAGRFIKAGLSGNDKYDSERKVREAEAKANAKRKLEELEAKMASDAAKSNGKAEESPAKKKKKDKSKKSAPSSVQTVGRDTPAAGEDVTMAEAGDIAEQTPKKKTKKSKKAKAAGSAEET